MKKVISAVFLYLVSISAFANGYTGVGIGLSEACRTQYQPSFAGGDCIGSNVDVRFLMGQQINDYFSFEGSLDGSFDPGHILETIVGTNDEESFFYDSSLRSNRWSVGTLALHTFVYLPLTDSTRLFAGPSIGGSIVNFDYDVKYFGNGDDESHSATEFGLNYGWAAGIELFKGSEGLLRIQWQNWRSLDADVAANGEFNSNTLTINFISSF
jgi:hypothetical protein